VRDQGRSISREWVVRRQEGIMRQPGRAGSLRHPVPELSVGETGVTKNPTRLPRSCYPGCLTRLAGAQLRHFFCWSEPRSRSFKNCWSEPCSRSFILKQRSSMPPVGASLARDLLFSNSDHLYLLLERALLAIFYSQAALIYTSCWSEPCSRSFS